MDVLNVDDFTVKNKIILITGATGYLGSAMVKYLSQLGANIIGLSTDKKKIDHFSKRFGFIADFFICDLTDDSEVRRVFSAIGEKYKHLDVLVNNASFATPTYWENLNEQDWDIAFDGNIKIADRCVKGCLPYLEKSKSGRIINISSMYGMVSPHEEIYDIPENLNPLPYGVCKAGLIQYSKYMAMVLAKKNITVNSISYGPFPKKDHPQSENFLNNLSDLTMLKRFGVPEDAIAPVFFLALPASSYTTGQNIIVDGGWTAW